MSEIILSGDEIVYKGVRGWVVYTFAVPSSDGPGYTIKLRNMRSDCVVNPNELQRVRY